MTGGTLLQLKHSLSSNLAWIVFRKNRFISREIKKNLRLEINQLLLCWEIIALQDTKLHWVTTSSKLSVLNLVLNTVTTKIWKFNLRAGKGRECSAVRFLALPLFPVNMGFVGPETIQDVAVFRFLKNCFKLNGLPFTCKSLLFWLMSSMRNNIGRLFSSMYLIHCVKYTNNVRSNEMD